MVQHDSGLSGICVLKKIGKRGTDPPLLFVIFSIMLFLLFSLSVSYTHLVATYVYENFHRHITLSDTALRFHISRSYLSKKFKAVTGFGFKEYLINIRIQNACRMLLETDQSITDIALSCGFNDSNYFGDAFRHVKGISPNPVSYTHLDVYKRQPVQ